MYRRRPTRFGFERLEQRQLLAGDVAVNVVAGQLFITGDNLANDIVLTSTGVAGQFTLSSGNFSPTNFNGSAAPLTVSGVTSHVFVDLRDGTDQFVFRTDPAPIFFGGNVVVDAGNGWDGVHVIGVNSFTAAGSMEVRVGTGPNVMSFYNLNVGGNLTFALSDTLDHVRLDSGSVAGNLVIDTGAGADTVYMDLNVGGDVHLRGTGRNTLRLADMVTETRIGGSLYVDLDNGTLDIFNVDIGNRLEVEGSGAVRMGYSDVGGNTEISLAAGPSSVWLGPLAAAPDVQQFGGHLIIELGPGGGEARVESANVASDLVIRGGAGNDTVLLTNVRAAGSLSIDAGAGNNVVRVQSAVVDGGTAIIAGDGGDLVTVNNFRTASLYVGTGGGFDRISVRYSSIAGNLSISSGAGGDQVGIAAVSARNLWIDAGAGYDAVRIDYSAFDTLFAQLGSEDDSLALQGNLVRVAALLDGGAGFDILWTSGNILNGLVRRNFAVVI